MNERAYAFIVSELDQAMTDYREAEDARLVAWGALRQAELNLADVERRIYAEFPQLRGSGGLKLALSALADPPDRSGQEAK